MAITIVDVAKAAGVSRTTVSNILNGNYRCTEETKEKVLQKAKEMGYRPNIAAKTLVKNTSKLIGIIFPYYMDKSLLTGNPFYNLIIDGINSTLLEMGEYDLIINCISQKKGSSQIIDWIAMRNLDGIIVVGDTDNKILREIEQEKIPMILVDNYSFLSETLDTTVFINSDDEKGLYMATNYLLNKGHENIGFCSSYIGISSVNTFRYEGYKRAIKEKNMNENIFETENVFFDSGVKIAGQIANSNLDSVVCTSDILALGLIKGLKMWGKSVPQDIEIIGFDNLDICSQYIPTLTTVNQDIFEKGKKAVSLLLQLIKKEKPENNKFITDVFLVTRESTHK